MSPNLCENNVTSVKSISDNFQKAFDDHFSSVVEYLCQDKGSVNCIKFSHDYIKEVLNYNVPHGKKTRGRTVVQSYLAIVGTHNVSQEDLNIALTIGWAVEIMQAAFLVADDIMDQSETRRGKLCWYRKDNIGLQAINDSMILESCIFQLLKACCRQKPYYADVMDLFHQVILNTELGQNLDMETSEQPTVDFSKFSYDRYLAIVKYKTAFYSFCLPVAVAMHMAGIKENSIHEKTQEILIEIGTLFQIQDDYLDCYGDVKITGKVGTDIEDNKCSWLVIKAIEKCTKEQLKILEENYASRNPEKVKVVKEIYESLNLKEDFLQFEKETYEKLKVRIAEFNEAAVPQVIFTTLLNTIYQRQK